MELHLGYDTFDAVRADVSGALSTLSETRRVAGREVETLLDGGWSGAAASSFAEAWSEWLDGAAQVDAALSSILGSLSLTRRSLTLADDAAAGDSSGLQDRLG